MLDRPTTGARAPPRRDRWRVYRQRQRDGVISVPVDVGPEVLELLLRTGWLAEEHVADRHAIALAIGAMLKASARRR